MSWRVRAGLLMFRLRGAELEVFLAHPGRPTPGSEDTEEWTIPKGGQKQYETLLEAAQREFEEEVGIRPQGPYLDLGSIRQKNGKMVHVWAFQGEWDESHPLKSPTREVEWPPASGRMQPCPEMDRVGFFPLSAAREKLRSSQRPLLDRLEAALRRATDVPPVGA